MNCRPGSGPSGASRPRSSATASRAGRHRRSSARRPRRRARRRGPPGGDVVALAIPVQPVGGGVAKAQPSSSHHARRSRPGSRGTRKNVAGSPAACSTGAAKVALSRYPSSKVEGHGARGQRAPLGESGEGRAQRHDMWSSGAGSAPGARTRAGPPPATCRRTHASDRCCASRARAAACSCRDIPVTAGDVANGPPAGHHRVALGEPLGPAAGAEHLLGACRAAAAAAAQLPRVGERAAAARSRTAPARARRPASRSRRRRPLPAPRPRRSRRWARRRPRPPAGRSAAPPSGSAARRGSSGPQDLLATSSRAPANTTAVRHTQFVGRARAARPRAARHRSAAAAPRRLPAGPPATPGRRRPAPCRPHVPDQRDHGHSGGDAEFGRELRSGRPRPAAGTAASRRRCGRRVHRRRVDGCAGTGRRTRRRRPATP